MTTCATPWSPFSRSNSAPGKVQVRAGHEGRPLGVRNRSDGAGFRNGIAPDVLAERMPHAGPAQAREGGRRASSTISTRCCARPAPTATTWCAPTSTTRRSRPCRPTSRCGASSWPGESPPSTSIAQQRLLLPDADMNIQAIGVMPPPGFELAHVKHEHSAGRANLRLSGGADRRRLHLRSRRHRARDRRRAEAQRRRRGGADDRGRAMGRPADQARNRISSSRKRIMPSLALAGATLDDVMHAQVYLTDPQDYSAFNEVWQRHFGRPADARRSFPASSTGSRPTTARSRSTSLAVEDRGGDPQKQPIDVGMRDRVPRPAAGGEGRRSPVHVRPDGDRPRRPRGAGGSRSAAAAFSSWAEAQAECIIGNVARLCEAAGTSLANVVRILQFHTDIGEFHPVYKVWERALRRPAAAVLGGRGALAAGAGRARADRYLGLRAVAPRRAAAVRARDEFRSRPGTSGVSLPRIRCFVGRCIIHRTVRHPGQPGSDMRRRNFLTVLAVCDVVARCRQGSADRPRAAGGVAGQLRRQ